jgi:hypothetical protein
MIAGDESSPSNQPRDARDAGLIAAVRALIFDCWAGGLLTGRRILSEERISDLTGRTNPFDANHDAFFQFLSDVNELVLFTKYCVSVSASVPNLLITPWHQSKKFSLFAE